jgi:hypothetical protein
MNAPRANTAVMANNVDSYYNNLYRGNILQRIGEVLGINKTALPDNTRDMIKELNPFKFIRTTVSSLLGSGKTEK